MFRKLRTPKVARILSWGAIAPLSISMYLWLKRDNVLGYLIFMFLVGVMLVISYLISRNIIKENTGK
jgi:hypothetical protein